MGDFKALTLFVALVIYFFLFLFIANVGEQAEVDNYISLNESIEAFCTTPRHSFDADGDTNRILASSKRCVKTKVGFDESGCNSLEGCTWVNESTFFFWSSPSACEGDINRSFYTNESIGLIPPNLCVMEGFQDQDLCFNIGCTWMDSASEINVKDTKGMLELVGELFTFRYDFGFSGLYNVLTVFFSFWLPFLLLIGCVYYMLPFIH
jgi:hypothetical protein